MADRNLRKTDGAGHGSRLFFMVGIAPGVHENDGDGLEASGFELFKFTPQLRLIQWLFNHTVTEYAFVNLGDLCIK